MININYIKADDGLGIEASGHAGYARKGYDIVCAGISSLAQGLFATVSEFGLAGLFEKYDCRVDDGYFFLAIGSYQDKRSADIMDAVFTVFYNGAYEIANSYRDYVSLSYSSKSSIWRFTDIDTSEETMEEEEVK